MIDIYGLVEKICIDYNLDIQEIANRSNLHVSKKNTAKQQSQCRSKGKHHKIGERVDNETSGTSEDYIEMENLIYDGKSYWIDKKDKVYELNDEHTHATMIGSMVKGTIEYFS